MRILVRKFENRNRYTTLKIYNLKIIILFLLFLSSYNGVSQNKNIFSKNDFEESSSQNRMGVNNFKRFSTSLLPAKHVQNNQIKVGDNNPICLFMDYSSLSNISNLISDKTTIEYISIRIKEPSEISSFIDLSVLTSFTNLKYIHIIFEYEFSNSRISMPYTLIQNPPIGCFTIYENRKIM